MTSRADDLSVFDPSFFRGVGALATLRRRGGPTDICFLSNAICITLVVLPLLLRLLCLLLLLLCLYLRTVYSFDTAGAGYDQLFVAVCVGDESAVADVFGVRPVGTALLSFVVAVRAVWESGAVSTWKVDRAAEWRILTRVQTRCVATHDVAVRELAARVTFRAIGAVPAWWCGGMFEGAVRVGAVGVEFAIHLGGQVCAFLRRRGVGSDAFLVCASGAVGALVGEIECDTRRCGGRLVTEVT